MMKKIYTAPQIEIVECKMEESVLIGSVYGDAVESEKTKVDFDKDNFYDTEDQLSKKKNPWTTYTWNFSW